jgi:hypothetical protein
MCTVTFIPSGGKIFLVSNRDEKHSRGDAEKPVIYSSSTGQSLYPKDADCGGSWISMHENGNAAVLLNGAIQPHVSAPPYRRSRGLILLDLFQEPSIVSAFGSISFGNIEPFTVVLWEKGKLWEGRWDGHTRQLIAKDKSLPHIWSSVTLYDEEVRTRREKWFNEWMLSNPDPSLEDIMDFHQVTGEGDQYNDLLMNRDGQLYTVSITGMEMEAGYGRMLYKDLRQGFEHFSGLSLSMPVAL